MTNIQHSSANANWYTPITIIERARAVLGTIDLDPASDEFGNSRVMAKGYYTEKLDGLSLPWHGSVFLNPPGGKLGIGPRAPSRGKLFWEKLLREAIVGHITHAIFIAFSLEMLQNTQKPYPGIPILPVGGMCNHLLCIPSARLKFDLETGKPNSPTHANAIVYVSRGIDNRTQFVHHFKDIGQCMVPSSWYYNY